MGPWLIGHGKDEAAMQSAGSIQRFNGAVADWPRKVRERNSLFGSGLGSMLRVPSRKDAMTGSLSWSQNRNLLFPRHFGIASGGRDFEHTSPLATTNTPVEM